MSLKNFYIENKPALVISFYSFLSLVLFAGFAYLLPVVSYYILIFQGAIFSYFVYNALENKEFISERKTTMFSFIIISELVYLTAFSIGSFETLKLFSYPVASGLGAVIFTFLIHIFSEVKFEFRNFVNIFFVNGIIAISPMFLFRLLDKNSDLFFISVPVSIYFWQLFTSLLLNSRMKDIDEESDDSDNDIE